MKHADAQWRKYTGDAHPRAMSPHILFFMAAQLALNDEELNRIISRMSEIGAYIDCSPRARG